MQFECIRGDALRATPGHHCSAADRVGCSRTEDEGLGSEGRIEQVGAHVRRAPIGIGSDSGIDARRSRKQMRVLSDRPEFRVRTDDVRAIDVGRPGPVLQQAAPEDETIGGVLEGSIQSIAVEDAVPDLVVMDAQRCPSEDPTGIVDERAVLDHRCGIGIGPPSDHAVRLVGPATKHAVAQRSAQQDDRDCLVLVGFDRESLDTRIGAFDEPQPCVQESSHCRAVGADDLDMGHVARVLVDPRLH